jgi:hypothetical protein
MRLKLILLDSFVMLLLGYELAGFGSILLGYDFLEYFDYPTPAMQGFVTSICFPVMALTVWQDVHHISSRYAAEVNSLTMRTKDAALATACD